MSLANVAATKMRIRSKPIGHVWEVILLLGHCFKELELRMTKFSHKVQRLGLELHRKRFGLLTSPRVGYAHPLVASCGHLVSSHHSLFNLVLPVYLFMDLLNMIAIQREAPGNIFCLFLLFLIVLTRRAVHVS